MHKAIPILSLAAALGLTMLLACQQQPTEKGVTPETSRGAETSSASGTNSGRSKAEARPRTATLEAGTTLRIRTMSSLSTSIVKTGEGFAATLEDPIVDGTWVIAPKGATVRGVITESDPGGKVEGRARLAVQLIQIQTADGQTIDLTTDSYVTQAKPSKKKDAKKVAIASGIGAAIGAIAGGGKGAAIGAGAGAGAGTGAVLTTRGDPAVIHSESVLRFKLKNRVTITERN